MNTAICFIVEIRHREQVSRHRVEQGVARGGGIVLASAIQTTIGHDTNKKNTGQIALTMGKTARAFDCRVGA